MDGKLLFCVSVGQGDNLLYGPEWKEAERGISLVDLFLQVCGSKVLGQQVQVLVSKDREFLEGAVVQVCSPLSHLAEKSQSYIKFIIKGEQKLIIKGEQKLPKNAFNNSFASERDPSNTSFKPSQDRITSLCMNDPLMTEKWRIKSDTNMLHTLATKPTFENMTVEEICDEIRNIRKTEMSKNKLSSWSGDDTQNTTSELKSNASNIIKEIKEMEEKDELLDISCTEKPKRPSPVPKSSLPKSSPLPPKKKTEVKRSTSFRSNKSFKRLSESTRNKLNGKKHVDNRNKEKDKAPTSKNTKAAANNAKNISERLSILAQPRKRHSEPNIVTSPTLQTSTQSTPSAKSSSLSKRSMEIKTSLDKKYNSMERLNRKSRDSSANSTFIKGTDNEKTYEGTNVSNANNAKNAKNGLKPKGKKKTDPTDEYFIQIYAKDKPENRSKENTPRESNNRRNSVNSSNVSPIREPTSKYTSKHSYTDKSKSFTSAHSTSITSSTSGLHTSRITSPKDYTKDSIVNYTKDSIVNYTKDSIVNYSDINDSKSRNVTSEYSCGDFIPDCISPVKGRACASPLKGVTRSYNTDYSSPLTSSSRVLSVDNLLASINAETERTKRGRHESLSIDEKDVDKFEAEVDKLILSGYQSPGNETKSPDKLDHKSSVLHGVDHKSSVLLGVEKVEKDIVNLSREILHSSGGNTSIENIIDTYLVPSPTKTSTKSPLFTHLLEKNNLKHSSTRSTDSSLDDVIDTSNDSKDSVSSKHESEHESRIPTKPGFTLGTLGSPIKDIEKKLNITSGSKINNSYSSDNEPDKISKIPVNNKKLSPKSSPEKNRLDGTDKMWANSRGIKFMKESMERNQPLHISELETEDKTMSSTTSIHSKSSSGISHFDKSRTNKSPLKKSLDLKLSKSPEDEKSPYMRLPLSLFNTAPSTSTPTSTTCKGILSPSSTTCKGILSPSVRSPAKSSSSGTSTPDRNRKMWGNSIDGMDTMLIPSLQAFSLELRTLSETVTCNLTSLYENFQRRYGGLDIAALNEGIAALNGSKRAFTPTSPRHNENGGDQQGVAIVFRNLRKIEGQMRSIEQATLTMLKVLNEKTNNQGGSPSEKGESGDKSELNTSTRSVCWSELKNASCTGTSNLTYWLNEQERAKESNSESVN